MSPLIVIPCTDRKRFHPDAELRARTLPEGTLQEVATAWAQHAMSAEPVGIPKEVYSGRAFREGLQAAEIVNADLVVISAGLGLVEQGQQIPAYGLTVARGKPDSVEGKVARPDWSPADWWDALRAQFDHGPSLKERIEESEAPIVLMSLSENYGRMVGRELEGLGKPHVARLRIFGSNIARHLPGNVVEAVMPYDRSLDGPDSPIPGTLSDFGARALHHYCQCLKRGKISGENAQQDRESLANLMSSWAMPIAHQRKKLSDSEILSFILEQWSTTGGRSQATHRLLRENGFACEQSRFKGLFHQARAIHHRKDVIA